MISLIREEEGEFLVKSFWCQKSDSYYYWVFI